MSGCCYCHFTDTLLDVSGLCVTFCFSSVDGHLWSQPEGEVRAGTEGSGSAVPSQ